MHIIQFALFAINNGLQNKANDSDINIVNNQHKKCSIFLCIKDQKCIFRKSNENQVFSDCVFNYDIYFGMPIC